MFYSLQLKRVGLQYNLICVKQHNDWTNKDYVQYFIRICKLRYGSYYFNKNFIPYTYEGPENIAE